MKMKDPKPKLKESSLYFGDNGRLFCGKLRCAGMSSFYSGRDISGQKVVAVRPEDVAEFDALNLKAACESCGQEASRLVTA